MASLVASLPLPVLVVAVLFLFGMSGLLAYAGLHARSRAALVKATPTTPIGMATDGYREFEGRVEAVNGQTVRAPLTHWACCWYHAKVEKYEHQYRDRQGRWTTSEEWTSGAPFFVRDATGVAIVDPHCAEVTPTDKSIWYGATPRPTDRNPPRVPPTASARGTVEVAGGRDSRKYRYSEERIYAGDPLLVLGEFTSGRFGARPDEDEPDDSMEADDVEAGQADGEAGRARSEDDDGVARIELEETLFDQARALTRATISRGSGAKPFLMTTSSQAAHVALSTTGGTAALAMVALPLAIAILLLWTRFG
jgi:hypothetical protein